MFQDRFTQLFFITVIEIIKFVGVFHEQKKSESGFSHKTMSCQHPQSGHNSFKIPEVSLGWLRVNGVEHG